MTFSSCLLYAKKIVFSKTIQGTESSYGKRSLIGAILCIGISLVPLITSLVVSSCMMNGIVERMINLYSHDISISLYKNSTYTKSYENFILAQEKLSQVSGVNKVFPEVRSMALAAGTNYRSGALVRGIPSNLFSENKKFSSLFKKIEGDFNFVGGKNAVIGEKIAEQLNLHVGDSIKLISLNSNNKQVIPKVAIFNVSGIVSSGYQELDALWVFIPLEEAFSSIAKSSSEFLLGIETANPFSDELFFVEDNIRMFALQDEHFANSQIATWQEINEAELENLSSTKALLLVVMAMIVIVAIINVSSSIVMIVMERKKEIALLKCVGASSIGITISFVLTGLLASFGGIIFGSILGILFSININRIIRFIEIIVAFIEHITTLVSFGKIQFEQFHLLDPAYYLQEIPVKIPITEIIIISIITLLLATLVSLIPALKAGNEKPIDTLRKM